MRARLAAVPRHRLLLAAILALALGLRLFRLGSVPVGINGDELFNAIDAAQIGPGNWPVYFPGNQGREALFLYLMAAAMALFGRSVIAFRLPAALLGGGTVLLGYLLGRDLFSRRVGLLAAAFTAVSLWPLMHSRWGLRAVSLTFCTGLALFWLNRALRHGRLRDWALGGLASGLVLYTYIPGRLFPLVVLAWLGWVAWRQRAALRTQWRGVLLAALLALLVFAPFGGYMLRHQDLVNQRIYSMSAAYRDALDGDFAPLRASVTAVLGMFSFRGDDDWRYHVADQPAFDPLTSLFFVLGAGLSLWFAFRPPRDVEDVPAHVQASGSAGDLKNRPTGGAPAYALLWLWAGAMLTPNALLDANPSFLRAAGAILPLYLMLAVGVDAAWRWLPMRLPALARRRRLLPGLVALGLLLTLARTWHSYFDVWANNATVRDIYQGDLTMMGRFIAGSAPDAARIF
ncbi:MAG: glycosyltransferase family 39 protein, partial [Anaerolineales bacterium]|nr:glycosyltransferase family 39 protein [Anaerolineales bacterium]